MFPNQQVTIPPASHLKIAMEIPHQKEIPTRTSSREEGGSYDLREGRKRGRGSAAQPRRRNPQRAAEREAGAATAAGGGRPSLKGAPARGGGVSEWEVRRESRNGEKGSGRAWALGGERRGNNRTVGGGELLKLTEPKKTCGKKLHYFGARAFGSRTKSKTFTNQKKICIFGKL